MDRIFYSEATERLESAGLDQSELKIAIAYCSMIGQLHWTGIQRRKSPDRRMVPATFWNLLLRALMNAEEASAPNPWKKEAVGLRLMSRFKLPETPIGDDVWEGLLVDGPELNAMAARVRRAAVDRGTLKRRGAPKGSRNALDDILAAEGVEMMRTAGVKAYHATVVLEPKLPGTNVRAKIKRLHPKILALARDAGLSE